METFRKYFKKASDEYFLKENFEVLPFCSSRFSDHNTNVVSRILNSFVVAINGKTYLPSYILLILDADLIDFMQYKKYGVSSLYSMWIEFLAKQLIETIDQKHGLLPKNARLIEPTQIYLVEPVNHSNFSCQSRQMRDKFAACLDSVSKIYDNMRCLKIRHPWDKNDSNLVIDDRITKAGLFVYWKTIDVSFCLNFKKSKEFLIRSKFRALKEGQQNVQNNKKATQLLGTGCEDTRSVTTDLVPAFFRKHRQFNRFHWKRGSNIGNEQRFLLLKVKARKTNEQ